MKTINISKMIQMNKKFKRKFWRE